MKVRVTLITENNSPVSALGENPEETIKNAWELMLCLIASVSDNGDSAYVEKVEILN